MTRSESRLRPFAPLAGFVLPTVLIGYGVVILRRDRGRRVPNLLGGVASRDAQEWDE
jgi:hypothetical protein